MTAASLVTFKGKLTETKRSDILCQSVNIAALSADNAKPVRIQRLIMRKNFAYADIRRMERVALS